MKISVRNCYILAIFTIMHSVSAKSVYDSESKFRDESEVKLYPVKRKSPNYEQSYYVVGHEEQPDAEYSDSLNNLGLSSAQRYRRIDEPSDSSLLSKNVQSPRDYKLKPSSLFEKQLDLRREIMQNALNRRTDRINKRELEPLQLQSDEPFGMVYRKGRLVGILEPYPQVYELAPLSNVREGIEEIQPLPMGMPNTRQAMDSRYSKNKITADKQSNSDWSWGKSEGVPDGVKYTDDKYPMVLTDFKIDSKMNRNSYKRDNIQNPLLTGQKPEKNIKLKTVTSQITKLGDEMENNEKINSLLSNSLYHKEADFQNENSGDLSKTKLSTDVKRNVPAITNEKISELKSALNRMQNPDSSDKVEEIEEDLRSVLSDMGLIDNEAKSSDSLKNKRSANNQETSDKRQTDKEDENLELGANKIEIVRTTHESPKSGKEKCDDGKEPQTSAIKDEKLEKLSDQTMEDDGNAMDSNDQKLSEDTSALKSENSMMAGSDSEKQNKEENETAEENVEQKRATSKVNVADYQSEGAAYIRNKRQETSTGSNDIMTGLEKSGELTVSGNKSPLASSENGPNTGDKHSGPCSSTAPTAYLENSDLNEVKYQTEIERNLQAKIDAIKEEVKREIAALQTKNIVADAEAQEKQRKKRDAPITLLEGETSALNPQEHPEEKLEPYIRRKRNSEGLENIKRVKRGLPDFSNLKNIDSGDYLELSGDKKQENHEMLSDYQMDPQENKYLLQSSQRSEEGIANADDSKGTRNAIAQQETITGADAVNLKIDGQENVLDTQENNIKVIRANGGDSLVTNTKEKESAITQEENLVGVDTVNLNINNQDNSLLQENTLRVSERSVDDSSTVKSTLNNEMATKEVDLSNKGDEKSESVTDKVADKPNVNSAVDLTFGENRPQLQESAVNIENLQDNKQENSQEDVKKRQSTNDQVSSKKLIDSVVNQNFKEQLKKLSTNSVKNPEVKIDKGHVAKSVTKSNGDTTRSQLGKDKENVSLIKSEMKRMETPSLSNVLENQNQNENVVKDMSGVNPNFEFNLGQKNVQETSRKRRQIEEEKNKNTPHIIYRGRRRANAVLPYANMAYLPYRAEEEVDDDGNEFDDYGFDDRTALVQKRETNYNNDNQFRRSIDYDTAQEYELPEGYFVNNYQPEQKNSLARRYVSRMNSDVYENPSPGDVGNYLYNPDAYVRRKRQDFDQMVALHGGGPTVHHITAIKERNERNLDTSRNKQKIKRNRKNKEESQNIADLSDTDLFGALPQNYEGELSRFKRVKRVAENTKKQV